MASFKDVLIRDVRSENACNLQFQHTPLELKRHQDLQFSRVEPSSNEDEIPDIDEVEIPECERFENLFLIGKIIGESLPVKTLASKTKADWLLTGEVRYVDMGNGFTLIKFSNEMDCNYAFLISHGLSKDKS